MTLIYLPDTAVLGSSNLAMNCQGDRVLVGTPSSRNGDNTGAAFVLDATTGKLLADLQPPCLQHQDYFGSSVAMNCDGSRALVGAKRNKDSDLGVSSPGVVYLFDIIDTTDGVQTNLLQTFTNPNPQDYDEFGIVVTMDQSGETVAIASPNHNHNQGIVYIYNKNGRLIRSMGPPSLLLGNNSTNLLMHQPRNANKNTEHNLHRDQFFGSSLALSEDSKLLLVGAPGKGWTKQLAGAAYLFDTSTGDLLSTIHDPSYSDHTSTQTNDKNNSELDGSTNKDNYFASSLAMSSNANTLVVGAMRKTVDTGNARKEITSGMVHVFNRSGHSIQTFTSPNKKQSNIHSAVNDHFGISVSITRDGHNVLVGAPYSNLTNDDTSAESSEIAVAFLFDVSSGDLKRSIYNPIQEKSAGINQTGISQPKPAIEFGGTVSLAYSGRYAAVSSAFHPAVEIVCLHKSCPRASGPSELIAIGEHSSGAIPLLNYDSSMCLVPHSTIDTTTLQQLDGLRKSKLSVLTLFLVFLGITTLACIVLFLRKSHKKNARERRGKSEGEASENGLKGTSVPSWKSLPEIL